MKWLSNGEMIKDSAVKEQFIFIQIFWPFIKICEHDVLNWGDFKIFVNLQILSLIV